RVRGDQRADIQGVGHGESITALGQAGVQALLLLQADDHQSAAQGGQGVLGLPRYRSSLAARRRSSLASPWNRISEWILAVRMKSCITSFKATRTLDSLRGRLGPTGIPTFHMSLETSLRVGPYHPTPPFSRS